MTRLILLMALIANLLLSWRIHGTSADRGPRPGPAPQMLAWMSLGEHALAARLTLLVLQAADPPNTPLRLLDRDQVLAWMEASQRLDPRHCGGLLAAARVYGVSSQNLTQCKGTQAQPGFR
jgi:hypothetical protein